MALPGAEGLNVNCGLPITDRSRFREHAAVEAKGLRRVEQGAAEMRLRLNVEAPHLNGLAGRGRDFRDLASKWLEWQRQLFRGRHARPARVVGVEDLGRRQSE